MFEVGDLVCDGKHPERLGFISELLFGKNSKELYIQIRWLNFPWGNPHTRTLELPEDIVVLSKVNKNENAA